MRFFLSIVLFSLLSPCYAFGCRDEISRAGRGENNFQRWEKALHANDSYQADLALGWLSLSLMNRKSADRAAEVIAQNYFLANITDWKRNNFVAKLSFLLDHFKQIQSESSEEESRHIARARRILLRLSAAIVRREMLRVGRLLEFSPRQQPITLMDSLETLSFARACAQLFSGKNQRNSNWILIHTWLLDNFLQGSISTEFSEINLEIRTFMSLLREKIARAIGYSARERDVLDFLIPDSDGPL